MRRKRGGMIRSHSTGFGIMPPRCRFRSLGRADMGNSHRNHGGSLVAIGGVICIMDGAVFRLNTAGLSWG